MTTTIPTNDSTDASGVFATCAECGDEHRVSERNHNPVFDLTTRCPVCEARPYSTRSVGGSVTKSERERILHAVRDIPGVGTGIARNLATSFSLLAEVERADPSQLQNVDGVGEQTAERIAKAL